MGYVLLVDDEAPFRRMLRSTVQALGYEAREAASGEAALALIAAERPAVVLLDLRLGPGTLDGLGTLREIRARFGELPVALITGYGDVQSAVAAMKLDALDFLEKPIDLDEVRRLLLGVLRPEGPEEPPARAQLRFGGITPQSSAFQAALELLAAAAESSAPVLLRGESGTGKELAAAFVHQRSPRAAGPFVKVNCAALAPSLLESEMFGHDAGAFTGAAGPRPGRFEAADGGTLLLDEIGELDPGLQAKLLRVIQEQELERVGSTRTRKIDVRVVATTNRDIAGAIAAGRFREDLYFRLNVFEVLLPPLRARPDDVLPLARHFVRALAQDRPRRLDADTERALLAYSWPGNVRELENAMERAAILARGGVIHPSHLPPSIMAQDAAEGRGAPLPTGQSDCATVAVSVRAEQPLATVRDMERELIVHALAAHDGNRTHAAQALGMSRRALLYKLKRYQLD